MSLWACVFVHLTEERKDASQIQRRPFSSITWQNFRYAQLANTDKRKGLFYLQRTIECIGAKKKCKQLADTFNIEKDNLFPWGGY